MRYKIDNGTVSLSGNTILDHISFEIRGNEKIAVVGENGSGKTTLLKLIAGSIAIDRDDKRFQPGIWMARNTTIGILEQNPFSEKHHSVEQEILTVCGIKDIYSKERYDFEMEYDKMFTAFGFSKEDKKKDIDSFSGGEQTKIALIRLLLSKPDILLLDEPTNHLDMDAVMWLENYLNHYEKAVVIVSHDRYFLDRTAHIIYELSQGKLTRYSGNYSDYKKQREKNISILQKNYREQQDEIKRLQELIIRFKNKPKKAAMARSKKKILERMEMIESPHDIQSYIYPESIIPDKIGSKCVYSLEKMRFGYDRPLYEISMRVKRGQKIGIIGANGSGKSTFLKTLHEQIPMLSGKMNIGTGLEIAYYDQWTGIDGSTERVYDYFSKHFPSYDGKQIRKILSRYLFRNEDMGKRICDLSGGERCRLEIAGILEKKPNVLLLDEPTNHMDIPTKEILESAFQQYGGTILFISHDRYFIHALADALLILENDDITYYPYSYRRYCEMLRKRQDHIEKGIESIEEENQLMTESFEQVPKKTRMQSARFNEEQSYSDWQLELASSELARYKKEYEDAIRLMVEKEYYSLEEYMTEESVRHSEEEPLEEAYTDQCIEWYLKWEEYQDAFDHYKDE